MARSWKVLITDHVWPSTDPERAVLEAGGASVVVAPDGEEETLTALARDADAIMTCFAQVTENVVRAAGWTSWWTTCPPTTTRCWG